MNKKDYFYIGLFFSLLVFTVGSFVFGVYHINKWLPLCLDREQIKIAKIAIVAESIEKGMICRLNGMKIIKATGDNTSNYFPMVFLATQNMTIGDVMHIDFNNGAMEAVK